MSVSIKRSTIPQPIQEPNKLSDRTVLYYIYALVGFNFLLCCFFLVIVIYLSYWQDSMAFMAQHYTYTRKNYPMSTR